MKAEDLNCFTCVYSSLPDTAEPCASCDMYFSHFESTQATDTAASEDARRCSLCKFRNVPIVQSPCRKCALTPGLPSFTSDTTKLVEMEMMTREEAKQMEAEMLRRTCDTCRHRGDSVEEEPAEDKEETIMKPTCLTCKHKGVSIEEEPCISCNGYQNYTPDESAPCAEGTDENDDVIEPCNNCTHRDNLRCNPPCSHCRQERGIEYPEYEEDEGDEEDVLSPCSTCKYGDLPGTTGPCASCFDEGLDHPLNYEEATDSGVKGIVPQYIVDMFTERVKQEVRRYFEACDAHPRPCPYCGEIPEVVEETIYPGEKHCYVVCNGAKLLPHSISIHGRTREEAVARWNSFVLTMKSQEK